MPTIHKIVLSRSEEGGTYRARPASVVAEPDDSIRFLNFSDATIDLTFPDGLLSPNSVDPGSGWDATIPTNATAGRHEYQGTVSGTSIQVVGESHPEIIVDRSTGGASLRTPAAH